MGEWRVPKPADREPGVLYVDTVYSKKVLDGVKSVVMQGLKFEKERFCSLKVTFHGDPCNDYVCSNCGKMHNAPRSGRFCPRCGAKVTEVEGELMR